MKILLRLLIVILALNMGRSYAEESPSPSAHFDTLRLTGTSKVKEVIDPLTVTLKDGKIVRLSGLDIPDFDPYEPGDYAVEAREKLRETLEGKEVHIYQTKNRDIGRTNRMGHELAHLEIKDSKIWVQGMLLEEGLARVRTTQRNREMAQQMYTLEMEARKKEIGLWGLTGHPVLTPEMAAERIGSYQIVEGRVASAAVVKNKIFLNFGSDWRKDFTVSIPSSARRLFSKDGIDPLQWNKKKIRARGWLESWNGPYIEIDHPERIEVLDLPAHDPPPMVSGTSVR